MRNQAVISVNSWLDQFQLMMPRNLWQGTCVHQLYDAGCTLNQASFAVNAAAVTGSTQSTIITAGFLPPSPVAVAGYLALGQLTFTSGLNTGFFRRVKSWDGTTAQLNAPFPFAVAFGDLFTAYPGCDKVLATCTNKFANQLNFRGHDLIPQPEIAV